LKDVKFFFLLSFLILDLLGHILSSGLFIILNIFIYFGPMFFHSIFQYLGSKIQILSQVFRKLLLFDPILLPTDRLIEPDYRRNISIFLCINLEFLLAGAFVGLEEGVEVREQLFLLFLHLFRLGS